MSLVRGLLFDNLGLKLVALLLAVVVYLHVYTERPFTALISFTLQLDGLADSLSLSGPVPPAVQAELRGTGKQLIRLRLTEPRLKISLDGVAPGRFERTVSVEDLPLLASDRLEVERMVGPRMIDLQIERKVRRRIPAAARVEGSPAAGFVWQDRPIVEPSTVMVQGPERTVARLDSIRLDPVRIEGRRDTVRFQVRPQTLPQWCSADPAAVWVTIPLQRRNL